MRKILGAVLALALSSAASLAATIPIFDGTVTYLAVAAGTTSCSGTGNSFAAIYRPQIGATAGKTGLVWQLYRAGVGFTMTGNGQFNGGAVPFVSFTLTQVASLVQKGGVFSGTQVPAAVTNATQTIDLRGDFVPSAGCHHKIHAVFVRRSGT